MASALPLIVLLCLAIGQLDGRNVRGSSRYRVCIPRPLWARYGSRYFVVESRSLTMADAELNCIRLGGNLASIRSYSEHAWIRALIRTVLGSNRAAWIGLFDAVQERKWLWTDGTQIRFTRWARGQPNNYRGREHCTYINNGDYWNDYQCNVRLPSVCVKRR
ncbi:galactose-specific lectin nattectin-like [Acanthopagrus latus]|uniref:galactose-specific lectin nattectin-like n=1 Tax=Acanthopagrus latus TaxID=8177 RepID=UPI00187BE10D|nr:galactose-specific lectin nattectin-like [Acanthopagrus latus]